MADDLPDGSSFVVTAAFVGTNDAIHGDVFVYWPELHPLEGYWREVGRIPCDDGPEFVSGDPVGNLRLTASGRFVLTWMPLEYETDLDSSGVSLLPDLDDPLPEGFDGEGSFSFDGDQLLLHAIWLGSWFEPPACGHRFERW